MGGRVKQDILPRSGLVVRETYVAADRPAQVKFQSKVSNMICAPELSFSVVDVHRSENRLTSSSRNFRHDRQGKEDNDDED